MLGQEPSALNCLYSLGSSSESACSADGPAVLVNPAEDCEPRPAPSRARGANGLKQPSRDAFKGRRLLFFLAALSRSSLAAHPCGRHQLQEAWLLAEFKHGPADQLGQAR